jgi:hypothetical protein
VCTHEIQATESLTSLRYDLTRTLAPGNKIEMNVRIRKSRDSSVGIALGYGLDDRGFRVPFPAGARNFSLHHRVQTGSGVRPPSYPVGTKGSFPGGKVAGA